MIRAFNKMDKPLLILSIFMFIFGLFMILDASSMKSFLNTGENTKYFFRQLIFLVSALVMAIIIIRKPLKKYNKLKEQEICTSCGKRHTKNNKVYCDFCASKKNERKRKR